MNVNRFASTAKLTRLIVALVFAGLATVPSAAQIQNRVCDTIPYDYIHNRIVIPVVLNGIPVRYIVDTGGQTGTVAEVAVKAGAKAQGYAGVSDLNSNKSVFQKGVISNVALSPHHTLAQLSSLILPENGFFDELRSLHGKMTEQRERMQRKKEKEKQKELLTKKQSAANSPVSNKSESSSSSVCHVCPKQLQLLPIFPFFLHLSNLVHMRRVHEDQFV